MAVGSERDWLMVFTLSGALSVHKILLAFALGKRLKYESLSVIYYRSMGGKFSFLWNYLFTKNV